MIITPTTHTGKGTHGLEPIAGKDSVAEKAKGMAEKIIADRKSEIPAQPQAVKAGELSEEEAREYYDQTMSLLSTPTEESNLGHSGLDAKRVAALLDL